MEQIKMTKTDPIQEFYELGFPTNSGPIGQHPSHNNKANHHYFGFDKPCYLPLHGTCPTKQSDRSAYCRQDFAYTQAPDHAHAHSCSTLQPHVEPSPADIANQAEASLRATAPKYDMKNALRYLATATQRLLVSVFQSLRS